MIRILTYDGLDSKCGNLRMAVDAVMASLGSRNHGVDRVRTPEDLHETVRKRRSGFFDLLVCCVGTRADDVFAVLQALREEGESAHIAIIAEEREDVRRALAVGAEAFFLSSEGPDGLRRALSPLAADLISQHDDVIGLRLDEGVGNIVIDEIMFVESSKRGAVIHLADGRTPLVRMTLQALFEKLEGHGAFVKAGSSFIVNLDNVRSLGDGAIVFPDGESIIIPVRVRKPMKDALSEHQNRERQAAC
ncbi:MAG: LytTR family transcriptional regulator DNA-binding domain-containing protein [Coriobacteriales bacterium]|jgi:CheY-like chemotaxis protein